MQTHSEPAQLPRFHLVPAVFAATHRPLHSSWCYSLSRELQGFPCVGGSCCPKVRRSVSPSTSLSPVILAVPRASVLLWGVEQCPYGAKVGNSSCEHLEAALEACLALPCLHFPFPFIRNQSANTNLCNYHLAENRCWGFAMGQEEGMQVRQGQVEMECYMVWKTRRQREM